MNKYVRLQNNERLQKDIDALKKYFGTVDETQAIKSALTLFLFDHVNGYGLFTGDVTPELKESSKHIRVTTKGG